MTGRRSFLRLRRLAIGALPLLLGACDGVDVHIHSTPEALRAGFSGRDPNLRWDGAGHLHVIYVEGQEDAARVVYRRLGPEPLGPFPVSPPGVATAAYGETPPTVEVLPSGVLVAAYPVPLPGKWKNEIRVQRSEDSGRTWSAPALLHPQRQGAHSFFSSVLAPDGTVRFAWLDDSGGRMGLHTASTDDGRTFSPPATLDDRTCECCGTALAALPSGIALAYRDEAESPKDHAEPAGEIRDLRVAVAGTGKSFSPAVAVAQDGWRLAGCPHTGPRFAAADDGGLWTAWFTGAEPGIYAASSRDGGASFEPKEAIAQVDETTRLVRHPEIGNTGDGGLVVLYESVLADGTSPLMARRRDPATGAWKPAAAIAPTGAYPRWAHRDGKSAVAFTCPGQGGDRIVVANGEDALAGRESWEGCLAEPKPAEEGHAHGAG